MLHNHSNALEDLGFLHYARLSQFRCLQDKKVNVAMRILVCGGRDYNDQKKVWTVLNKMHNDDPISCIITGDASGADSHARNWAYIANIDCEVYKAEWHNYGHSAGPVRNREMLLKGKPNMVIAFPGGKGTRDMMRVAASRGVPVLAYEEVTKLIARSYKYDQGRMIVE